MACSPISASDETEFLTKLENELTVLDNSLIKLSMVSQEQKSEIENLSILSTNLQTKVRTLQTQLEESQTELTLLQAESKSLESQWEGLKNSLEKEESELRSLTVKNKLLVGGICISLALGLVAVIVVVLK